MNDKADEFDGKMDDIEKVITLKKRFLLQCERLGEDNPYKEVI